MEFRDLKRQYQVLKADLDKAMLDIAASGGYIMGGAVSELEEQMAEYVGVKHCMTCANGTDALTLALKTLGIGKGDAVFVPDFTFFASAEVVAAEGATPVFVDVDPQTFNIDTTSLREAIHNVEKEGRLKQKAIIAVDLFGLPADFASIKSIAAHHGLYVIEDGAQGFGGCIGNKRACSFGDIGTTSFFPAKPLGCYGDGGAVFTNNDEWADLIRSLRVHGKGSCKYDNIRIGLNSRLDTIQAAILKVKFEAFKKNELALVNIVAEHYTKLINENINKDYAIKAETPHIPEGFLSSWAQYTIRLNTSTSSNGISREELQSRLKASGIPTMVYYPTPMSLQTAFKGIHHYVNTTNATHLSQCVLSLPMHPYMTDTEIQTVIETLAEHLK